MSFSKAVLLFPAAVSLLAAAKFPAPALDLPPAANQPAEAAVLAGGCYWGMQAVFERLHGVLAVTAGYAAYSRPPRDASP